MLETDHSSHILTLSAPRDAGRLYAKSSLVAQEHCVCSVTALRELEMCPLSDVNDENWI